MTNEEAHALALPIYESDKACFRGHTARYTKGGSCVACTKLRDHKRKGVRKYRKWREREPEPVVEVRPAADLYVSNFITPPSLARLMSGR